MTEYKEKETQNIVVIGDIKLEVRPVTKTSMASRLSNEDLPGS